MEDKQHVFCRTGRLPSLQTSRRTPGRCSSTDGDGGRHAEWNQPVTWGQHCVIPLRAQHVPRVVTIVDTDREWGGWGQGLVSEGDRVRREDEESGGEGGDGCTTV